MNPATQAREAWRLARVEFTLLDKFANEAEAHAREMRERADAAAWEVADAWAVVVAIEGEPKIPEWLKV